MFRISDKLWLVLSTFFAQAMRIAATMVLARLVSRSDYGLFFVIGALPGLVSVGDMNIPASLIQMQESDDVVNDTALLLGVGLYSFYSIILIGGSAYLSMTHHDWRLWVVGVIVAVTNLLNFLYYLRLADLNRQLHFKAESKQNFIYATAQGASAILFAFGGLGIFALALQGFVGQIVASIAAGRGKMIRIPRSFSMPAAKKFVLLGGKVSLGTYVGNFQNSTTALTINQLAGEARAGDWGRATMVLMLFAQNFLNGLERVAYPILCRAAENLPRLRDLLTKVAVTLLLSSGFMGAWLFSTREDLVSLGLGRQWTEVPPLLAQLTVSIPAFALTIVSYHVIYALGKTGVLMNRSIIGTALYLPALYLVRGHGVAAIGWVWIASQYVMALLAFGWVVRTVRPPLTVIIARGLGLLSTGALVGFLMRLLRQHLLATHFGTNTFIRFTICSAAGLALYTAIVLLTQREVIAFAWRMARPAPEAPPLPPTPVVDNPPT